MRKKGKAPQTRVIDSVPHITESRSWIFRRDAEGGSTLWPRRPGAGEGSRDPQSVRATARTTLGDRVIVGRFCWSLGEDD